MQPSSPMHSCVPLKAVSPPHVIADTYSNEFDLSAGILQATVTMKEMLVHKTEKLLGSG